MGAHQTPSQAGFGVLGESFKSSMSNRKLLQTSKWVCDCMTQIFIFKDQSCYYGGSWYLGLGLRQGDLYGGSTVLSGRVTCVPGLQDV